MGEFLDRAYQRQLLDELRGCYPDMKVHPAGRDDASRRRSVNLHYLLEHGLIEGKVQQTLSDGVSYAVKISARGLDFLQDDGGLGAILGVVTVKLHDETILRLVESRIEADPKATELEKSEAKSALRKLPEKVLGALVEEMTKKGLQHFPDLLPWITQHGHSALGAVGLG